MTFHVGDPAHVAEHNRIAAQEASDAGSFAALASATSALAAGLVVTNTTVATKVAKNDLVIDVDDQTGATDDLKIDAAITLAAASSTARVVRFGPRTFTVNATHTLTSIAGLELRFTPGSIVKIGEAPTGTLADRARVFLVNTSSRIRFTGIRVDAPTTPLVSPSPDEPGIIQILDSTDCVVEHGQFNLTNVWPPSTTFLDGGINYQVSAAAVFVKGTLSARNLFQDSTVTGGIGATYAYAGSKSTTVRRVTVTSSPSNGFSGVGNNGSAWAEDNVLDGCVVQTCSRIGIEDWSKIRRSAIRDCKVYSPGLMGISAVGANTRIINPYVEGSPTYTGVELTSSNVVVLGGRVVINTTTASQGIVIDNNSSIANGDTASAGTLITGTEVRGALFGINQVTNVGVGQITLADCRVFNWGHKGICLVDVASGGLPAVVTGCLVTNGLQSVSTSSGARIGIQVGTGAKVTNCDVRVLSTASGGVVGDIPLYFGSNDQLWSNIRVDGGTVTLPFVPGCISFGATPSGTVIENILLTGGATLSLAGMVSPTARHITGTTTWGTGGGTAPVKVGVSGGADVWAGTGSPESVVTAPVSSLYHRRDGGAGTTLYVKETGSGNTGWVNYSAVTSVAGRTGAVVLTKTDVSLANVDNTSDANKPVSTAQAAANALLLPLAGGTLSGDLNLGSGNKVVWATDTNVYRSAADTLKTDDALIIAAPAGSEALNVSNNTAANSVAVIVNASAGGVRLGRGSQASPIDVVAGDGSTLRLRIGATALPDGILFGSSVDTNVYRSAADTLKTDDSFHVGATLRHLGSSLGFYSATAVTKPTAYTQTFSTAAKTVNAYTTDPESSAYTGSSVDSEAKLVDLNNLRVAYENLRASHDNLLQVVTAIIDDLQALGLVG